MATAIDAAALLTYRAAWLRDVQGARDDEGGGDGQAGGDRIGAAGDRRRGAAASAALGVTRGQIVERLYREIRALRIYEGATEVQKLIVARELLRR